MQKKIYTVDIQTGRQEEIYRYTNKQRGSERYIFCIYRGGLVLRPSTYCTVFHVQYLIIKENDSLRKEGQGAKKIK